MMGDMHMPGLSMDAGARSPLAIFLLVVLLIPLL
jgi:hypothetical protein